jgi:two-component system cell cycle response regulator
MNDASASRYGRSGFDSQRDQGKRLILVDPSDATRDVLARRLRAQGWIVEDTADPAVGADLALRAPPAAVISELFMEGISGVQLCRLLRAEPATSEVAVILCGEDNDPRSRFWADRAGANDYVPKRRTGELMRALARATAKAETASQEFFFQLSGGDVDVRDRIARQLDRALFDSVIAAEVRALASCGDFEKLFDSFIQFFSQIARYRWVAIWTHTPDRVAVLLGVGVGEGAVREAMHALGAPQKASLFLVEDGDARLGPETSPPITATISCGGVKVARIALSPASAHETSLEDMVALVARELGGPIRMALLVEHAHRLAATDPLTGLMNRRALASTLLTETARASRHRQPLVVMLLDVDHFKSINDHHGHLAGDEVLRAIGELLRGDALRASDIVARWGGEEFVAVLPNTPLAGARIAAERVRRAVEDLVVESDSGARIAISASIGIASFAPSDKVQMLVDRADRAMYMAKSAGRNRVVALDETAGNDVEIRRAG